MVKSILFLLLVFASVILNAQVWAPAGATWHYTWAAWATGFPPACDYITGVDENSKEINQVKIYPNPASAFIKIEINTPLKGDVLIELSDISGKRVRQIETDADRISINIEDLDGGIYFVRVIDQRGFIRNQKIIKTN